MKMRKNKILKLSSYIGAAALVRAAALLKGLLKIVDIYRSRDAYKSRSAYKNSDIYKSRSACKNRGAVPTALLFAALLLVSCGGGSSSSSGTLSGGAFGGGGFPSIIGGGGSAARNFGPLSVEDVRAFPLPNSVRLVWLDPILPPGVAIDSYSVVVYTHSSPGVLNTTLSDFRVMPGSTTRSGRVVSYEVTGVSAGMYSFEVGVSFTATPGIQPPVPEAPTPLAMDRGPLMAGASNRDNDEYIDSDDPEPDSRGFDVELGDLDGDGYYGTEDPMPFSSAADIALGDPDGDRRFGTEDAFPLDVNEFEDTDDDGTGDKGDLDKDGDGLIEIGTMAELDNVRNDLTGASYATSATFAGNFSGCPSAAAGGCRGYELTADLDLAGSNWTPIGSCGNFAASRGFAASDCEGASFNNDSPPTAFDTIFEGNHYTISNINIVSNSNVIGAGGETELGFFGALAANAVVRNLRLTNVDIVSSASGARAGGLTGYARSANINLVLLEEIDVALSDVDSSAGALAGEIEDTSIAASAAVSESISAGSEAGGLVGVLINDAQIHSSISVAKSISIAGQSAAAVGAGGIAGSIVASRIINSLGLSRNINTPGEVGGLVGFDNGIVSNIRSSYWEESTSFNSSFSNGLGAGQSPSALRATTGPVGIYAGWQSAWCNPATGEFSSSSASPGTGFKSVWDFGTASVYPGVACFGARSAASLHTIASDVLYDLIQFENLRITSTVANADRLELAWTNPGELISANPSLLQVRVYEVAANRAETLSRDISATVTFDAQNPITSYQLSDVPPGTYRIEITPDQFAAADPRRVVVPVSASHTVPVIVSVREFRGRGLSSGQAVLSWVNPNVAGAQIESFSLSYSTDGGSSFQDHSIISQPRRASGATVRYIVSNLAFGDYIFRLRLNLVGGNAGRLVQDKDTDPVAIVALDRVRNLQVVAHPTRFGEATLSWQNPTLANIAGFRITRVRDGGTSTTRPITPPAGSNLLDSGGQYTESINDLGTGTYEFTVVVIKADGTAGRETKTTFTQGQLLPVENVVASWQTGDRGVTLTWTNPDISNIHSDFRILYKQLPNGSETAATIIGGSTDNTANAANNITVRVPADGDYEFTVHLVVQLPSGAQESAGVTSNRVNGVMPPPDNVMIGTPVPVQGTYGSVVLPLQNPNLSGITSISIRYVHVSSGASSLRIITQSDGVLGANNMHNITLHQLRPGRYTITASLTSTGGPGSPSQTTYDHPPPPEVDDFAAYWVNDDQVSLAWDNPDLSNIGSFNISYRINGADFIELSLSSSTTPPVATDANDSNNITLRVTPATGNTGSVYAFTIQLLANYGTPAPQSTGRIASTVLFPDGDGDRIPNIPNGDNCPLDANPDQANADGDSFGDVCDTDNDNDNIENSLDVDEDGDGLIEIGTAAELEYMGYNLTGAGLTTTAGGAGNTSGCGGQSGVTACNGYELTADIDLSGNSNWTPVGSCTSSAYCPANMAFAGIFEGNDYTISNLNIDLSATSYGVGLFGYSSSPEIRNLNLANVDISSSAAGSYFGSLVGRHVGGGSITDINLNNVSISMQKVNRVGGMVGQVGSGGSSISDISLETASDIVGSNTVGGLLGRTEDVNLTKVSVVSQGSIAASAADNVGGIIGYALASPSTSSALSLAYVDVNSITAVNSDVGGLVGESNIPSISSSFVRVGRLAGTGWVGGLVGDMNGFNTPGVPSISSSLAIVDIIDGAGQQSTGGLVGDDRADGSTITSSVAVFSNITGDTSVGGLLGSTFISALIRRSYALANKLITTRTSPLPGVGPLVGSVGVQATATVTASYHNVSSIESAGSPNSFGEDKTFDELRAVGFTGDFATWGNSWCDPATGEFTDDSAHTLATAGGGDTYRTWDLGTNAQMPVLNCLSGVISAADQRREIGRILGDMDGDGFFDSEDPIPNSDTADVMAFINGGRIDDGDKYIGSEDAFPNNATEWADTDGDLIGDNADTCPTVSNPGAGQTADSDGDGFAPDACGDVDGDGDGLIEIRTATELALINSDLAGTSKDNNSTGCPTPSSPGTASNGTVLSCVGYELANDIDLSEYNNWSWFRIGFCDAKDNCPADKAFTGRFEGNGHTLSNLNITLTSDAYGVGLFGSSQSPEIRNLNLVGMNITTAVAGNHVGSLVGHHSGDGKFTNISVDDVIINTPNMAQVGGLIGRAQENITLEEIRLRTTRNIIGDSSCGRDNRPIR